MNPLEDRLRQIENSVSLVLQYDGSDIDQALCDGRGRLVIAVGAGPFLAVAHYFARCRTTLGLGISLVMTPMEFILSLDDAADTDIWLFGDDAHNPEMRAASRAAGSRSGGRARRIFICHSGISDIPGEFNPICLPVIDLPNGPDAIYSMVAMVSALLFASDRLTERPHGAALASTLIHSTKPVGSTFQLAGLNKDDRVLLLHDPQLMPFACMMEAFLWQYRMVSVHRSDFHEFACNQYRWSFLHSEPSYMLALTTCESQFIWDRLRVALPTNNRSQNIGCGDGGRYANASAMLQGLAALPPSLPAVDDNARCQPFTGVDEILGVRNALDTLAANLTPAVVHKLSARHLQDPVFDENKSLSMVGKQRLRKLASARFVGIACDYDGTVVPNEPPEARLGAPPAVLIDQLVRLVDDGILVGIATGRGSSAGARMREALPERLHSEILIGYFNGALIQTLDVDISVNGPEEHRHVAEVTHWVASSMTVKPNAHIYAGSFQVTVLLDDILDVGRFVKQMATCPAIANGEMRLVRSQHSFDVIPSEATKLSVVRRLSERSGNKEGHVLAIGDSGSAQGNDYELLLQPHAISVDHVCGDCEGTWSLFGNHVRGPAAFLQILQSMRVENGSAAIDVAALGFNIKG